MVLALLIVLLVIGLAGGVAFHPWVFLLALVALVAILADHRRGIRP